MKTEIDVLALLDRMDKFRRSHQDEKSAPSDYCMRFLEAMLADAAGFSGRASWTTKLREDENSEYSKEITELGAAFRG